MQAKHFSGLFCAVVAATLLLTGVGCSSNAEPEAESKKQGQAIQGQFQQKVDRANQ